MEKNVQPKTFEDVYETVLDERISYLEKGEKRANTIATIAGAVGAVSLLTIIGNVLTDDINIALQTTGSCIAMATYSIGNLKLRKYYKNLVEKTTSKKGQKLENLEIATVKEQLENYKSRLEYYKINHPVHVIAGIGFAESFLAALINATQATGTGEAHQLLTLVFGSAISGLVALGHVKLAQDSKSQIATYESMLNETEQELELREKTATKK